MDFKAKNLYHCTIYHILMTFWSFFLTFSASLMTFMTYLHSGILLNNVSTFIEEILEVTVNIQLLQAVER